MNQKELFWISVTVFLTIVAWMIFDIYKAKIAVPVESQIAIPVSHLQLDANTLQIIKQKTP